MKSPRQIAHEVNSIHSALCMDAHHLPACERTAEAIERARAEGLIVGFREARGGGEDATAGLAALGVSEAVYMAVAREAEGRD